MTTGTVEVHRGGRHYTKTYDFNILMLKKTQKKNKTTVTCPGYDSYTNSSRANKRGLATYIRHEIWHLVLIIVIREVFRTHSCTKLL